MKFGGRVNVHWATLEVVVVKVNGGKGMQRVG